MVRCTLLLILSIALAACDFDLPTEEELRARVEEPVTMMIGERGGTLRGPGVILSIPPGALESDTEISLQLMREGAPSNFTRLSSLYGFSPDGLAFKKPATVSIAFQDAFEEAAVLWSLPGRSNAFEALETTQESGMAVATISHFSRGFVARVRTSGPSCDPRVYNCGCLCVPGTLCECDDGWSDGDEYGDGDSYGDGDW